MPMAASGASGTVEDVGVGVTDGVTVLEGVTGGVRVGLAVADADRVLVAEGVAVRVVVGEAVEVRVSDGEGVPVRVQDGVGEALDEIDCAELRSGSPRSTVAASSSAARPPHRELMATAALPGAAGGRPVRGITRASTLWGAAARTTGAKLAGRLASFRPGQAAGTRCAAVAAATSDPISLLCRTRPAPAPLKAALRLRPPLWRTARMARGVTRRVAAAK